MPIFPESNGYFIRKLGAIENLKHRIQIATDKSVIERAEKWIQEIKRELEERKNDDPGDYMDDLKENIDVLLAGRSFYDLSKPEKVEFEKRYKKLNRVFQKHGRALPKYKEI